MSDRPALLSSVADVLDLLDEAVGALTLAAGVVLGAALRTTLHVLEPGDPDEPDEPAGHDPDRRPGVAPDVVTRLHVVRPAARDR